MKDIEKMKQETRELAATIVDVFDDFLDEKGISIPCADPHEQEDRLQDDNSASIYGMEYYDLEDRVNNVLDKALNNERAEEVDIPNDPSIYKCLDTSTGHLTHETVIALGLDNVAYVTAYTYKEGLFIVVPDMDISDVKKTAADWPNDLKDLFAFARRKDCLLIRLDRDSEETDELPKYDW